MAKKKTKNRKRVVTKKNRTVKNKKVLKKTRKIKLIKIRRIKKGNKIKTIKSLKKIRIKIHRKKVTAEPNLEGSAFSTKAIFRPKIKVIGIGGGGGSIVSEIGRSLEKASFVIADTDVRAIKNKSGIKYFYFGQEITHGLGTGMDSDLAKLAAEKEKERISKILEGQDIVILVASLGGGLGSGAAPVFAEISRNLGNVTLGIFTLPFKFEGAKKAAISHRAAQKLKAHLNAIITIPNERIFKIVEETTSITEAFSLVNKNLIESLESLIDMIHNPGLINIDFADVRAILKGRGMSAFLNTVEFAGKNRAEETANNILRNPLFSSNVHPEKILFNIAGSNNLNMLEVDSISRRIAELNNKAKIIFGISRDAQLKNKIKTTLLITGPSFASVVPEKKPVIVPEKKIVKVKEKVVEKIAEKAKEKKKPVLIKAKQKKVIKAIAEKIKKKITIPVISKPEPQKVKKLIRKNALEVKKAQEMEENKRLSQEAEWEIPAFLRRMKSKA